MELWLLVALVAGIMVTVCLKTLATEVEYEVRRHRLTLEAQRLRDKQRERLASMGIKHR